MIDLIMAEFGTEKLEPALSSMSRYFPKLNLILYSDKEHTKYETNIVKSLYPGHPREGFRNNDYYKVLGLLKSKAEVAISIDSDMFVCTSGVKSLIFLVQKFGLCLPANPRWLVGVDGVKGTDGDYDVGEDGSGGNGFANNMSPIAFSTNDSMYRNLLEAYCNEMIDNPVRGPLVMWRAMWRTGVHPYLLPPQWCVCQEHCGIGNEIILHVGHDKVRRAYNL
jgi:hypothetical protein